MFRQLAIIAFGLGLGLPDVSPTLAQTAPSLEITDLIPESVQYPKGPTIIVRNRSGVGGFEAWVIRHLDGAVVRKYQVPPGERWRQDLDVTEPKNDRLPALVEGENISVPFTLVFLNGDLVVEQSRGFFVRVNSPKGWPTLTAWSSRLGEGASWPSAKVAGGKFTAVKGGNLSIATREHDPAFTFVFDDDTKVTKAGRPWRIQDLRPGDGVSVAYVARGEKRTAREVLVETAAKPPSLFGQAPWFTPVTPPYLMTGARFQVCTVAGAKTVPRTSPRQGEHTILETKTRRGSMRWRVTKDTEIVSGMARWSQGEIRAETLVAVGAKELKGSPIPALRVLLLQDLSAPR